MLYKLACRANSTSWTCSEPVPDFISRIVEWSFFELEEFFESPGQQKDSAMSRIESHAIALHDFATDMSLWGGADSAQKGSVLRRIGSDVCSSGKLTTEYYCFFFASWFWLLISSDFQVLGCFGPCGHRMSPAFLLTVFARICHARHPSAQPQPSQRCPSLERCRNWKAAETVWDLNWARLRMCH